MFCRVVGNKTLEADAVEVAGAAGVFTAEFDAAHGAEGVAAFAVEEGMQAGKLVEECEGAVLVCASGVGVGKGFVEQVHVNLCIAVLYEFSPVVGLDGTECQEDGGNREREFFGEVVYLFMPEVYPDNFREVGGDACGYFFVEVGPVFHDFVVFNRCLKIG